MANYLPSAEAMKTPRRIKVTVGENGPQWVGVGASVTIPPNPPIHKGYVVKEATQAQYKILFERGLKHLVEKIEKAPEPAQTTTSNNKNNKIEK